MEQPGWVTLSLPRARVLLNRFAGDGPPHESDAASPLSLAAVVNRKESSRYLLAQGSVAQADAVGLAVATLGPGGMPRLPVNPGDSPYPRAPFDCTARWPDP